MIAAAKNNAENNQVLELVDDSLAEFRVLAGHCGTASLGRMLQLAHWWLNPDGRLLVIPEPGLTRRDLFPQGTTGWSGRETSSSSIAERNWSS